MAFKIAGALCILFGIADFALFEFQGWDITGVSWSPYVAGLLGAGLWSLGGGGEA